VFAIAPFATHTHNLFKEKESEKGNNPQWERYQGIGDEKMGWLTDWNCVPGKKQ
jgi:hypothetical protein